MYDVNVNGLLSSELGLYASCEEIFILYSYSVKVLKCLFHMFFVNVL